MFVTRNWYAAGRSNELGSAPLGRTICGRRIALFRDERGAVRAIDAVCPHRGADLAAGAIVGGTVRCPFHGFRFDGTGRCVEVPSQRDQTRVMERIRVTSYPVVERQQILWIWPDAETRPDVDPPRYDFFERDAGLRRFFCKPELYPASYLNTLENALDGSHLAFVHTRSVPGVPALSRDARITVYEDRRGYRGEDPAQPPTTESRLQRLRRVWSAGGGIGNSWLGAVMAPFLARRVRSGFFYELSGMVCFDSEYENGKRDYVLALITPADDTHTWFFAELLRDRALNPIGDFVTKRFMEVLVAEDRNALDRLSPEARGPGGLRRPTLVRADRVSAVFRRLYGEALRREGKPVPWAIGDGDVNDVDGGDPAAEDDSGPEAPRAAAERD